MHHIQKKFRARSYRRASYLFIAASLSLLTTVGFVAYAFFYSSQDNFMIISILIGATAFFWVLSMIASGNCRCQLCQTSNMRSLKCSRHKNAKRLLGSYRLRVSTSIFFTNSFRCPYCGEAFSLSPKPNRIKSTPKQTRIKCITTPSRRTRRIPKKRA